MIVETATSIRAKINNDESGKWACRAVCALYRAQVADEKATKDTRHSNSVGFSKAHAKVGSELAAWMDYGRKDGIMRRSCGGRFPEWLRENGRWVRNPSAYAGRDRMEVAREIALHYAGQLAELANKNNQSQKAA